MWCYVVDLFFCFFVQSVLISLSLLSYAWSNSKRNSNRRYSSITAVDSFESRNIIFIFLYPEKQCDVPDNNVLMQYCSTYARIFIVILIESDAWVSEHSFDQITVCVSSLNFLDEKKKIRTTNNLD